MELPFEKTSSSLDSCVPSYLSNSHSCELKIISKKDGKLSLVSDSDIPRGYVLLYSHNTTQQNGPLTYKSCTLTEKDIDTLQYFYGMREAYVYSNDGGEFTHTDTLVFTKKEIKKDNTVVVLGGLGLVIGAVAIGAIVYTANKKKK